MKKRYTNNAMRPSEYKAKKTQRKTELRIRRKTG
jgi:hypothetical protein